MLPPVFNPVSTSGAGFQLEHYVQASYLASLVLQTPLPLRDDLLVEQLVFQAKHLVNTDDLIVHLAGGRLQKQFIQSKHGFEINANNTFFEVIENCWHDYQNGFFKPGTDQFIITTQALTKTDAADGLTMLEWARFSHSASDFRQKVGSNKSKQAKLSFFQEALAKANWVTLDAETEWAFLKSFFIRTYDYLESGSRDKEILKWYLQPFIKSPATAEQVLAVLLNYVATCNQHGATVTAHSLPANIRAMFDLRKTESLGPELKGLLRKSFSTLNDTIHTDIDGFHLERTGKLDELVELAEQYSIVFITGEPGAGKSALQKNYLLQTFGGAPEFLFLKADTLDRSSLSQTLAEVGVHQDFQTIAAQWRLLPKLVLCIDGFEKLYESEHTGAFLELLETLKRGTGIKMIATCRPYALDTLLQKYRINRSACGILELPALTKEELQIVVQARPRLGEVISNPKLTKLVNKPFYLDIAIRVLESLPTGPDITARAFKEALWEHVVERRGHGSLGTARKRAKTFSRLVLKRAAERRAFVQPEPDMEEDIIEKLVQDELLVDAGGMHGYAPRHDILEDMVVIRDLRERYQHKDNIRSFLASLNTSPVYRRGLRLWLQEMLAEEPVEAELLLNEVLPTQDVVHWLVDEILTGLLGSDQVYEVLNQHQECFLAENAALLHRALRVLKAVYTTDASSEHPSIHSKSTGPGWTALLQWVDAHLNSNATILSPILSEVLNGWTLQFDEQDEIPQEGKLVARHCFRLLETYKEVHGFSVQGNLLEMLFRVAPVAREAVHTFLKSAVVLREQEEPIGEYTASFYQGLYKMLLVDTYRCVRIYALFPELVIELARSIWYRKSTFVSRYEGYDYLEASFGLVKYNSGYFSASAYQTPFRYLFRYHSDQALDFLLELTNRATSYYLRSDYSKQHGTEPVEIELSEERTVSQYGDATLWGTYRGAANAPYLIQSALMAFEAHLLEAASEGIDLEPVLRYVLEKSNSVLLTAVFASVANAYPLLLQLHILPLLRVRKLYQWDSSRFAHEISIGHTASGNEPHYTQERALSNRLPHRNWHLEQLVSRLQFFFPSEINALIDNFKLHVQPNDQLWRLALERMDMRNTEPEISEEENQIVFHPNPLPGELQTFVEQNEAAGKPDRAAMSAFLWAQKATAQEPQARTYLAWRENYQKIEGIDPGNVTLGRNPWVVMALVGLRDYWEQLEQAEQAFCVAEIKGELESLLQEVRGLSRYTAWELHLPLFLETLPLLLTSRVRSAVDVGRVKKAVLDLLLLLPEDQRQHLAKGIRNYCWEADPDFAARCVQTLFRFAAVEDFYQNLRYASAAASDPGAFGRILEETLIQVQDGKDLPTDALTLSGGNIKALADALDLVNEVHLSSTHYAYLVHILALIATLNDLNGYEYISFRHRLEEVIARYLVSTSDKPARLLLLRILLLSKKHFSFVMDILKSMVAYGHDEGYPEPLWDHLELLFDYGLTKDGKIGFFLITLFASISHRERCRKLPVAGKGRQLYERVVTELGAETNLTAAIFRLLTGIGSTYQPVCLGWLMKGIPGEAEINHCLSTPTAVQEAEAFVAQIQANHLTYLRRNRDQFDYLLLLLNVLVARGSKAAFQLREQIL